MFPSSLLIVVNSQFKKLFWPRVHITYTKGQLSNQIIMTLHHIIKDLRERHGLTQSQLAKRSGISRNYLSEIENGTKSPSSEVLDAISKGLGVPVALIMLMATEEEELKESNKDLIIEKMKPILERLNSLFINNNHPVGIDD